MKGKRQGAPSAFPKRVPTTARGGGPGQGDRRCAWGEQGTGAAAAQDLTDALAQRPQLLVVEVGVSLDARARRKGVRQEPVLPIEGISISVL